MKSTHLEILAWEKKATEQGVARKRTLTEEAKRGKKKTDEQEAMQEEILKELDFLK